MSEEKNVKPLNNVCQQIRRWILEMTTKAQSGHATSSLSAVELMSVLMFSRHAFFRYDMDNPEYPLNDRLIFSKGHASPLYYSLWAAAGAIESEELMTFRQFESRLEGHPTRRFPYTEVPTGSLGQGLAVGVGEALALRVQNAERETQNVGSENGNVNHGTHKGDLGESEVERLALSVPRVFVLLGDSEIAEGSVWEGAALASHYKLENLVAVVDVNRLGQRGETLDGWHISTIAGKFRAFGWEAIEVEDGHDMAAVEVAYERVMTSEKPIVLVAKTIKGKGVSFLENRNGFHGKALSSEDCKKALKEIGEVSDFQCALLNTATKDFGTASSSKIHPRNDGAHDAIRSDTMAVIANPESAKGVAIPNNSRGIDISSETSFGDSVPSFDAPRFMLRDSVATRKVYGQALIAIAEKYPHLVALDAEVSNSTYSAEFGENYPDRFFEMFIAEQNMVSAAVGMARRGYMPFVSTFGAFFTRAMDQIRMAQYADVNVTFVGSHVGVSIGDDGASQMGLEDMAMFRALNESTILYPSDATSMMACARLAAEHEGLTYIRTTRAETPVLYEKHEEFTLGGSKTLRESENDQITVIAAGVTVREALKAHEQLQNDGVNVRVVDVYSIKPIDQKMIARALEETRGIVVVEDHYPEGGLGAAVRESVCSPERTMVRSEPIQTAFLAVRKRPRSGTPAELLAYEEIDAEAIIKAVRAMLDMRS